MQRENKNMKKQWKSKMKSLKSNKKRQNNYRKWDLMIHLVSNKKPAMPCKSGSTGLLTVK